MLDKHASMEEVEKVIAIAKGISAHACEPYIGDNAIIKLINLYKVPDTASMYLDIRYTSADNADRIVKYVKHYSDDISITKVIIEPLFCLNQDLDIVKNFIKKAEKILKTEIVKTKCPAGSDAVYFSEKNIPVIIMNPVGDYWHNPLEYAEIDSYYTLYRIFKSIL